MMKNIHASFGPVILIHVPNIKYIGVERSIFV